MRNAYIFWKKKTLEFYSMMFVFMISCTLHLGNGTTEDDVKETIEETDDEFNDSNPELNNSTDESADTNYEEVDKNIFKDEDNEVTEIQDEENIEPEFPDLTGTWAQKTVFDGYTDAPILGNVAAWVDMYLLVKQTQHDDQIEIESKMCHMSLGNEKEDFMNLYIPDSFVEALPVIYKKAFLSHNENGKISFFQEKSTEIRSCTLEKEDDDLPVKADDSRVEDWDNDGVPGIMIKVEGIGVNADVSIVQKVFTILRGEVVSSDRIEGLCEWFEWQKVMKTDYSLFKDGSPTTPGDDAERSYFINIKLSDDADCKYVIEHRAELFGE